MQGGVGREEELNDGLVCPALEACWAQAFQTDPKPRSGFLSESWCSCSVLSDSVTLWLQPARLLCPWDFSSKNTGVDCHFLLQGIFLTQESNPRLLQLLYGRQFLTSEPPGKPSPSPGFPFGCVLFQMIIIYHPLNGHEFEQTPGASERQGSLVCCSPWGRKVSDTAE